jgi:alpha-L-rhamnosidase
MKILRRFLSILVLCSAASVFAQLTATDLRCDWGTDPLGIDSSVPSLAWKLTSPTRGAHQTAWEVRIASSAVKLAAGEADVWASTEIKGPEQLQIPYGGRPLHTGEEIFWQVRVWDEHGQPCAWSSPGKWTMGVVKKEDWAARWITDPDLLHVTRRYLGFSTPPVADENTPQWIVLDLGAVFPIEQIGLHALVHTVSEKLGFPRWFKVEVAPSADFHDATVVVDHTNDPINQWLTHVAIPVATLSARYVRLTEPRLRMMEENGDGKLLGRLALSQIEVRAGGKNVALGAKVSASSSLEGEPWSAQSVVDGLGLPGGNPRAASTLLLRREFAVKPGLRRATLFICGLGQYTLAVNGTAVGAEDLLTPGWTDYQRTCLYDTRDLTAQLRAGPNALGLTLASGMYNVPDIPGRYSKFVGAPRPLVAIAQLQLDYTDGHSETIVTDEKWKSASGPTVFAQVYGGEDFDARLIPTGWDRTGFNDAKWTSVVTASGPGGELRGFSESAPPIRAYETLPPVKVNSLRRGVDVYDLGQNTALMPHLLVHGSAGSVVKIYPSELLKPDGSVDWNSTHHTEAEAVWTYTLSGSKDHETWIPQFFYHGARYLQVVRSAAPGETALPVVEQLEGRVIHSDSLAAGKFATSNELFNRIHNLIRWAQLSNLVSILTDCPHRERLGWMEQYHLNGPSLRYEFDLTRLYAKTFGDMADGQLPGGLLPSIAPEYVRFDGYFRDSPEWGSALILAAWQQYVWTGDDTPFRRHYATMQRYFDYLTKRTDQHILSHGLGDWYDRGPNRPGVSQLTPIPLVATAIYYEDALAMKRIADHLGRAPDASHYEELADQISESFNNRFFDPATAKYATGSQTAQALPFALGIAPDAQADAILANLVEAVRSAGNTATSGDVGYRYLLRALASGGRSDVIFDMTNQVDQPGYGYQLAHGATSLTEAWDASRNSSQNHFMLGQIMEWFYHDLAGLGPDPTAPGFARIIVRPEPVGDIRWAEASYETVRGLASVRWDRDGKQLRLAVTVPANVRASIQLPVEEGTEVTEGGKSLKGRTDVVSSDAINGRPTYEVGSGSYIFETH